MSKKIKYLQINHFLLDRGQYRMSRKFLASCEDLFNERRPIECISHEAGAYVTQNTVDQDSPSGHGTMISANRLVRTRMLGGVGAGG
jgi:hypothetical protein